MRLKFVKIRRNPTQFFNLTGFTVPEFDELAFEFRAQWEQYSNQSTLGRRLRQRKTSFSRKSNVLPGYQGKLFFILMYLKTYPLPEFQSVAFPMTQPQINSWVNLLCYILQKTLISFNNISRNESKKLEQLLDDCQDILSESESRNNLGV